MALGQAFQQTVRAPEYRDVTSGLRETLLQNEARQRQKDQDYSQALQDYKPTAEQQTIAGSLASTKEALTSESEDSINASYDALALDTEYSKALNNLDASYTTAKGRWIPTYDEKGNVTNFDATEEGKAYKDRELEFNEKYRNYRSALEPKLQGLNATALSTMSAGYDPVKLQSRMQEDLISKGVGLESALKASTVAAQPYQTAPITEVEKIALQAKVDQGKELTKSELNTLEKLREGNEKITRLGGATVNPDGSITYTGKGGKAKSYSANEIRESQKELMDTFDNVGWGIWKDNKDIVQDYLNPLYQEFAGYLTPKDINDAIISFKDDGLIKDTLKSGTTPEAVAKVLRDKVATTVKAGGSGYTTTGQKAISNKEYETRRASIEARGSQRISDVLAQYTKGNNKSTGLANILARVKDYNATEINPTIPGTDKKAPNNETQVTKADRYKSGTVIGDAMNSSKKGLLAKALMKDPQKFGEEFNKLTDAQQKSVTSILSSKTSEKVMTGIATGIEVNKDKPRKEEPSVVNKLKDTATNTLTPATKPTNLVGDKYDADARFMELTEELPESYSDADKFFLLKKQLKQKIDTGTLTPEDEKALNFYQSKISTGEKLKGSSKFGGEFVGSMYSKAASSGADTGEFLANALRVNPIINSGLNLLSGKDSIVDKDTLTSIAETFGGGSKKISELDANLVNRMSEQTGIPTSEINKYATVGSFLLALGGPLKELTKSVIKKGGKTLSDTLVKGKRVSAKRAKKNQHLKSDEPIIVGHGKPKNTGPTSVSDDIDELINSTDPVKQAIGKDMKRQAAEVAKVAAKKSSLEARNLVTKLEKKLDKLYNNNKNSEANQIAIEETIEQIRNLQSRL